MAISPQMQERIGRIDKLIEEGYTLKKIKGFVDFRNASENPVNIYGFLKKSPAGFSWIAFFFPFAVCFQIKEWSYFYFSGIAFFVVSLIDGITGVDGNSAAGFAISLYYGYAFPYLRKIAQDSGVEEVSKWRSIVFGLILSMAVLIPSYLVDMAFGKLQ